MKKIDTDGVITYEDISVSDCADVPLNVPDIKQLDLWFDTDSDTETDHSPYNRDFTLLNLATREFQEGIGESISGGGYSVDTSISWNNILSWFGTNKGLNESPFTFRIKLQFNQDNVSDIVFQQLFNKGTATIPAGKVYFDWGVADNKLYFTFQTYGDNSLAYTFKSKEEILFNNTDVYTFIFALYDSGKSGIFGYSIGTNSIISLDTERFLIEN